MVGALRPRARGCLRLTGRDRKRDRRTTAAHLREVGDRAARDHGRRGGVRARRARTCAHGPAWQVNSRSHHVLRARHFARSKLRDRARRIGQCLTREGAVRLCAGLGMPSARTGITHSRFGDRSGERRGDRAPCRRPAQRRRARRAGVRVVGTRDHARPATLGSAWVVCCLGAGGDAPGSGRRTRPGGTEPLCFRRPAQSDLLDDLRNREWCDGSTGRGGGGGEAWVRDRTRRLRSALRTRLGANVGPPYGRGPRDGRCRDGPIRAPSLAAPYSVRSLHAAQ